MLLQEAILPCFQASLSCPRRVYLCGAVKLASNVSRFKKPYRTPPWNFIIILYISCPKFAVETCWNLPDLKRTFRGLGICWETHGFQCEFPVPSMAKPRWPRFFWPVPPKVFVGGWARKLSFTIYWRAYGAGMCWYSCQKDWASLFCFFSGYLFVLEMLVFWR